MNPASVRLWGQVFVGTQTLIIFLGVLIVVFLLKDQQLMAALVGYAAGNASAVVQFYFGSSASSQAKDEKMVPAPPEPK